jgi:preprotein translocase subunit SecG
MLKRTSYLLFTVFLITLVVVLQPAAGQASSQPQLPHTFWGKVFIGESPAGMGLEVIAVGPGVTSGVEGNPVTTLSGGVYGEAGMSSQKLLIQGDIEPGTPLEFFVGGVRAEVFPVSTNGPWKPNFSYIPGEDTELNIRIAAQVSSIQTRDPTPVQTRLPASAVQGFLPEPGMIATIQPGVDGTGKQPAVQPSSVLAQPPGTVSSGSQAPVTLPGENPPANTGNGSLPGGISGTMLLAGIFVIVVIVLGGLYFAMNKKKAGEEGKENNQEKKEELEEKKEE